MVQRSHLAAVEHVYTEACVHRGAAFWYTADRPDARIDISSPLPQITVLLSVVAPPFARGHIYAFFVSLSTPLYRYHWLGSWARLHILCSSGFASVI